MKHDGLLLVTNGKVVYEKLFFMNERRETGVSHYNIHRLPRKQLQVTRVTKTINYRTVSSTAYSAAVLEKTLALS